MDKAIKIKKTPATKIADIKKLVEVQAKQIARLQTLTCSLESSVAKIKDRIKTHTLKYRLEMEDRQRVLASMFQFLLEKVTMITEVGYHVRNKADATAEEVSAVLTASIRAIDYSDEWWHEGKFLDVKSWAERCLYPDISVVKVTEDELDAIQNEGK